MLARRPRTPRRDVPEPRATATGRPERSNLPPTPAPASDVVGRRLHGHDPRAGHDTAGLPWQGRQVHESSFAGDTGAPDPALAAALAEGADEVTVVAALGGARLLVPVVAMPVEVATSGRTGLVGDAHSDMATVVLTAPDGERALPVFTGTEALAAWDPRARPVPVAARSAAQAAIEERCSVLVLDVASPHRRVVRSSQLWALAQGRHWVHASVDPVVREGVDDAASAPGLARIELGEGPAGRLDVVLVAEPGLGRGRIEELTHRVAGVLADDDVRIRLDDVRITVRAQAALPGA